MLFKVEFLFIIYREVLETKDIFHIFFMGVSFPQDDIFILG